MKREEDNSVLKASGPCSVSFLSPHKLYMLSFHEPGYHMESAINIIGPRKLESDGQHLQRQV